MPSFQNITKRCPKGGKQWCVKPSFMGNRICIDTDVSSTELHEVREGIALLCKSCKTRVATIAFEEISS